MDLINFGLGLAKGILNVIAGATGSRGVALAVGIVGTIAASFANVGGGKGGAPAGQLLGVPAAATTTAAAPATARLPQNAVTGQLPGGAA